MNMAKTFKKYIQKMLSMVMYIIKLKLSMACDIGVENLSRTWCST